MSVAESASSVRNDELRGRPLTVPLVLAVVVHGPFDVGLTTAAWFFESNAVVLELGVLTWIAIKLLAISVAIWLWWDAPKSNPLPYTKTARTWLGVLIGFGLALTLPNLAIVLEVILA